MFYRRKSTLHQALEAEDNVNSVIMCELSWRKYDREAIAQDPVIVSFDEFCHTFSNGRPDNWVSDQAKELAVEDLVLRYTDSGYRVSYNAETSEITIR